MTPSKLTPEELAAGLATGTCPNCGSHDIKPPEPSVYGGGRVYRQCGQCGADAHFIATPTNITKPNFGLAVFREEWFKAAANGGFEVSPSLPSVDLTVLSRCRKGKLSDMSFNGVRITGLTAEMDIRSSHFSRCTFEDGILPGGNLSRYACFTDCRFICGVHLGEDRTLTEVRFESCRFEYTADLSAARLNGVIFTNCNGPLSLSGSIMDGGSICDLGHGRLNLRGFTVRGNVGLPDLSRLLTSLLVDGVVFAPYQVGDIPLRVALMLFDAAFHHAPASFEAFARGGACPYGGTKYTRAITFSESREMMKDAIDSGLVDLGKPLPFTPAQLLGVVLEALGAKLDFGSVDLVVPDPDQDEDNDEDDDDCDCEDCRRARGELDDEDGDEDNDEE